MISLFNFLYDFANSDMVYYVLIILLIVISLAMLYLVYSQNREISKQLVQKNREVNKHEEEQKGIVGSVFSELESLDGREKLLEVSTKTIPKHLEYTQTLFSNTELQDLQDITKEIETDYKDKKSSMDVYEEQQEESAIISYEELLSKTQSIPKVEEVEVKSENYKHEEDFLDRLKSLNDNLK